jgi:16S rRNA (guanine(966)-N(2))-methyltransferase RsmD
MKLRLIAGEKRGLGLVSPKGLATRPTLGRVRESLFMILRDELAAAPRVLDLFAGAGTLGLEALSRGAARATFVENARPALEALRRNVERAGWQGRSTIVPREALAWLAGAAPADGAPYDLVLMDPPYRQGLCERALELLAARRATWLAKDGLVVAQADRREALAERHGDLAQADRRVYSETVVAFYRPSLLD